MSTQLKTWMRICLFFGFLTPAMTFCQEQAILDLMLDKTWQTWNTVDVIRSIARDDRHHLYPRLIKANLDLYATTYWMTEQCKKDTLSPEYVDDVQQLFTALITAQNDTLSGQSISDNPQATLLSWSPMVEVPLQQKNIGGLFSCMIMDQTHQLWNSFTQLPTNTKRS